MSVVCFSCGGTIGHLILPFYDALVAKKKKGGNLSDNSDICEELGVHRDCCRVRLISFVPENELRQVLEKTYGRDMIFFNLRMGKDITEINIPNK